MEMKQNQKDVLIALQGGATIKQAAKIAGVNRSTIHRWLNTGDSDFLLAYGDIQLRKSLTALAPYIDELGANLNTLVEIRDAILSGSDTRIRAVREINRVIDQTKDLMANDQLNQLIKAYQDLNEN